MDSSATDILGIETEKGFDSATIVLASPERIRSWSHGEVKNPETINYRTFKPEKGGLFCERIFGPSKDWECSCGKYKRIKHKGVVCDRCGVEVTLARVRRERMGHIELAVPVSHIWFFKCTPSRIGLLLDLTARALERVLYYEDYIVVDPGETALQPKQLLDEMQYREAVTEYGEDAFVARMGAEGIRDLLAALDLERERVELDELMAATRNKQTRKKLTRRMKIVDGLKQSDTRPEWMIQEVLPVIPPDLRPLVPLEGGRFATSDLNDLYRRVINRNNRLRNLLQLKTPDVIIRNEKRMLQEAVDALFDNGRHGRPVTGAGNRALKSLSDMLKGKQGRFRQNLLGKRVDYSGRSVIVVGPELGLHQCGIPKKMALVLFEPFIIQRLKERGVVHNVKSAKKMIEQEGDEVWAILDEVTRGHTVLLNRAPTLHRLSVQAFEPVLIEGEAIRIHPLVCTAYNADFDGDQMAVHVPLSIEAQLESRLLMLAPNNIFSPSSGKPIVTPSQDIALGCYYLTIDPHGASPDGQDRKRPSTLPLMNHTAEVHTAYDDGAVGLHDHLHLRNPDRHQDTPYGDPEAATIETTVGRVFFNEIWPSALGFVNTVVPKKTLGDLIWRCYQAVGHDETIALLDRLKHIGFEYATKAGISIGLDDMRVPPEKSEMVAQAREQITQVDEQYRDGLITDGERHNKIIDIWTHTGDEISKVMFAGMERKLDGHEPNPIFMMVDSGARGSQQQIRQLAGMRGLMAKPSGEIIERPIISNFREGLTVLEYFISTHGARKGLADTALKTADSGYLTRKLVDVAQDLIVVEQDCGTLNGITVQTIRHGDQELVTLHDRILGRTVLEDARHPVTREMLVAANQEIDETTARSIYDAGIEKLRIRSALTCESERGICAACYGRDMTNGNPIALGEAVGIIAAQSIGEPGTQLTMRTFHIGGTASSTFRKPVVEAKNAGFVRCDENLRTVQLRGRTRKVLSKYGSLAIFTAEGRELERYTVEVGAEITTDENGWVDKGEAFVKWDPYNVPILSEMDGVVDFHDFIEGVTVRRERDESTGLQERIVMEHKEDLHPQILIREKAGGKILGYYSIPSAAHVMVAKGDKVQAGVALARTPRKMTRTKDITGGLPRVSELFEARKPKDAAEIAKIDGVVEFGRVPSRGKRMLVVKDPATGAEEEHLVPMGKHVVVFSGDVVAKGQQLTEGPIAPQEILEVCGPQALQEYLVNQVQEVYRLQGVEINDKHIELIVRQMLRKVRITDPGDTDFLWDDQVERLVFQEANRSAVDEGKRPAQASPVLLGITKAALETESFISAASFQDTTRVLTEASTLGRVDRLRGFKENVITGNLIPAGTGFQLYRNIRLVPLAEPIEAEELLPHILPEEEPAPLDDV